MRQLIEGYETSDREQRLDHIRKARWRTINNSTSSLHTVSRSYYVHAQDSSPVHIHSSTRATGTLSS